MYMLESWRCVNLTWTSSINSDVLFDWTKVVFWSQMNKIHQTHTKQKTHKMLFKLQNVTFSKSTVNHRNMLHSWNYTNKLLTNQEIQQL